MRVISWPSCLTGSAIDSQTQTLPLILGRQCINASHYLWIILYTHTYIYIINILQLCENPVASSSNENKSIFYFFKSVFLASSSTANLGQLEDRRKNV